MIVGSQVPHENHIFNKLNNWVCFDLFFSVNSGTNLERIAVYKASTYVKGTKNFMKDVKRDVDFKVSRQKLDF